MVGDLTNTECCVSNMQFCHILKAKSCYIFVSLFSLARVFHYFYDVALLPTRQLFTSMDSVTVAFKVTQFQKMYQDKHMTSYVQVYRDSEGDEGAERGCQPSQDK